MAANTGYFYIGTDTRITITGLQDEDGNYLNGADTVVGTMEDNNDNVITGGQNIEFTYVANSQGNFIGYVPAALALVSTSKYNLVLVIQHSGRQMTILVPRNAAYITA